MLKIGVKEYLARSFIVSSVMWYLCSMKYIATRVISIQIRLAGLKHSIIKHFVQLFKSHHFLLTVWLPALSFNSVTVPCLYIQTFRTCYRQSYRYIFLYKAYIKHTLSHVVLKLRSFHRYLYEELNPVFNAVKVLLFWGIGDFRDLLVNVIETYFWLWSVKNLRDVRVYFLISFTGFYSNSQ